METWRNEKSPEKLPFYELLYHSDCDGELTSEECKELLKDFRDLEKKINNKTSLTWHLLLDKRFNWWWRKFLIWKEAIEHVALDECLLIFT